MIDLAVILAAGRGTRLKEITVTRSKAMAPIAGSPMIARVMTCLREAGIRRFIIVAAPGDRELVEFCGSLGDVQVVEQREPKGSADALRSCEGMIEGPCVVCACDSLIPSGDIRGIINLYELEQARAAVAVQEVSSDTPLGARSVVALAGNIVCSFIEKPSPTERISNTTALPLWVFSSDIWRRLRQLKASRRGEYELPSVFNQMIGEGEKVVAHVSPEREDLTDLRDLLRLNRMFLKKQVPAVQVHESVVIPRSVTLTPPVLIEAGCVIGEGALIGPEVYLEHGVRVAAGVEIRESVVTRNVEVSESLSGTVQTMNKKAPVV